MQEKTVKFLGFEDMKTSEVVKEDFLQILKAEFIDWQKFAETTILITGGTGLIGSNLAGALLFANRARDLKLKVIIITRDSKHARQVYGYQEGLDIKEYKGAGPLEIDEKIDFIVHLASPTSSSFFSQHPVETLMANIQGTTVIMNLAREKKVRKVVYLSSMEVYGFPEKGKLVFENNIGCFETTKARNSYPISKLTAETICFAFHHEYEVPCVVLRATQTLGPGVDYHDNRVFAQFMRCVIEKKDIVLKSDGATERSYLYTADAVTAIITGLLRAEAGKAFTIANPLTYCSIREMAEMVANDIAQGGIRVKYEIENDIEKLGYAGTLFMNLDVSSFQKTGWKPKVGLREMFERMIRSVGGACTE